MRLTRRQFVRGVTGAAASAAGLGALAPAGSRRRAWGQPAARGGRPNFLLVLLDDMRFDAMGCSGRFPFLQTPTIDRLAHEGARFDRACVTTSLCSPSRASLLTSTLARTHGVLGNSSLDASPELPTFATCLQRGGYDTALIGKWHQGAGGHPRPGFNHWFSFDGQGRYNDPVFNRNGTEAEARGYITDLLADEAVRWLGERRGQDAPFCLCLWHKAVHADFVPAERHRDAFAQARIEASPACLDDRFGKPTWLRRRSGPTNQAADVLPGDQPTPERIEPRYDPANARRLNMLRTLLSVDEGLARVMERLEADGRLDDTVVILTSDNGYYFGEFGLTDKRSAYEPSARVPLLVRYPALVPRGARPGGLTSLLDLAPTMLDLAGEGRPGSMRGRSLVPQLRDPSAPGSDAIWYEYFQEAQRPATPTMFAVIEARWKYIRSLRDDGGFDEEVYDLHADPHELHNVAAEAGGGGELERLRAEFRRRSDAAGPLPATRPATRPVAGGG